MEPFDPYPLKIDHRSKSLLANVSNPDNQSVKENNNNIIKNCKSTTNTSGLRRSPHTNCDSPPTYSHSTAPISTSESKKREVLTDKACQVVHLHQFKLILIA